MQVKVLFFATLKDVVGSRHLQVEVPSGATIRDLPTRLEASYPRTKAYRPVLLTAINEDYVGTDARINAGDEVAIFPPVSGGEQANPLVIITHDPIDARKVAGEMLRGEDGAISICEGVVRNNTKGKRTLYLVYEAYESMALKKLEEIGEFVRKAWDIDRIALIHRLGHMDIGETSVAVIVTSAHRRTAFDACHYAID